MTKLVSVPEHGETIVQGGIASPSMQLFFDELLLKINGLLLGAALTLPSYTVLTVPDATIWGASMIYVTDETGGAIPAFSDGTNWRRVTDRTVVS